MEPTDYQRDKSKPDVLRVTEYILSRAKQKSAFSVTEASRTKFLNGIGERRIAEIMQSICLEPNGPGSLVAMTTVCQNNTHAQQGNWQLTADAYWGYLSYLAVEESKKANKMATYSLWVAMGAGLISLITAAA